MDPMDPMGIIWSPTAFCFDRSSTSNTWRYRAFWNITFTVGRFFFVIQIGRVVYHIIFPYPFYRFWGAEVVVNKPRMNKQVLFVSLLRRCQPPSAQKYSYLRKEGSYSKARHKWLQFLSTLSHEKVRMMLQVRRLFSLSQNWAPICVTTWLTFMWPDSQGLKGLFEKWWFRWVICFTKIL